MPLPRSARCDLPGNPDNALRLYVVSGRQLSESQHQQCNQPVDISTIFSLLHVLHSILVQAKCIAPNPQRSTKQAPSCSLAHPSSALVQPVQRPACDTSSQMLVRSNVSFHLIIQTPTCVQPSQYRLLFSHPHVVFSLSHLHTPLFAQPFKPRTKLEPIQASTLDCVPSMCSAAAVLAYEQPTLSWSSFLVFFPATFGSTSATAERRSLLQFNHCCKQTLVPRRSAPSWSVQFRKHMPWIIF